MKLSYDIKKTENNTTKIIRLSDHKIITFIIFIILRIISYSFFTPFIFLLGVNIILLLLIIQTSGIIDIKSLFESLGHLLYNIFGEQILEWGNNGGNHYKCSGIECENNLKDFVWSIIFILSIIFGIIDFLYQKIFNKNIKINLIKIIKYIIIFSYFLYILFFYFIGKEWSTIGVAIGIIPLLSYVYFSAIIALKFNKWSGIIYNEVFIINNKNKND